MSSPAGIDFNQRMDATNHRRTALHLAVIKRQPAALQALIEAGADLNVEDAAGLTPFDQAALLGDETMVRMLLDAGTQFSLPAAIILERHDIVEQRLRENPTVLSTTDNRRWARPLARAADRAPAHVVETLVRALTRHRSGLSVITFAMTWRRQSMAHTATRRSTRPRSTATTPPWRCC
jgi:ankyrin repeat protein